MNEREIVDYLIANPAFFDRQANLLAAVKLGNPHGTGAVSLAERQIGILRENNKHLERRLAELVRYGHENDSISAKLDHWLARVLAERDTHALPGTVCAGLVDSFDIPSAAVRLWEVAETYALADYARHSSEEIRLYANSLNAPFCGPNTGFEAAHWLGNGQSGGTAGGVGGAAAGADEDAPAAQVASLALIPLRRLDAQGAAFGLLAMGSPDERRFHAGMSTDFLARIGTLASAALSRLLPH